MILYSKPYKKRENRNSAVRIIKSFPKYQQVTELERKSGLNIQPESHNINEKSTIKINQEGVFLSFQGDGRKFVLSQFDISLILKNIRELKRYWSLPIEPYDEYNIQPEGREWRINRVPGWQLSHILNNVNEINKLLFRLHRLTNTELQIINRLLPEIFTKTEPFEIPDSRLALYRWQQEALDKWYLEKKKRGIVEAATGTGKTRLAFECISKFFDDSPNGLVCIIVPWQALFNQWQKELLNYFSIPETNYTYQGNGYNQPIHNNNTRIIITMQRTLVLHGDKQYGCSLIRQLAKTGRDVLLVADEVHHLGADQTLEKFVKHIPDNFFTLGLSATPDREDGKEKEVYRYFDCETCEGPIYSYPILKAVEEGTLSKVKQFNFSVSFNEKETSEYSGFCDQIKNIKYRIINNTVKEVDKRLLQSGNIEYLTRLESELQKMQANSPRYKEIWDLIDKIHALQSLYINRRRLFNKAESKWTLLKTMLADRKWRENFTSGRWIFFHEGKEECEKTVQLLDRAFGKDMVRRHHTGISTKDRNNILREFENNNFSCLCAVQTLDEGIDIPDLKGVVIVSGSTTKRQQIQRCGRALRRAPHKEYAYLVSILAKMDNDKTGEQLVIGPEDNTERWEINPDSSFFLNTQTMISRDKVLPTSSPKSLEMQDDEVELVNTQTVKSKKTNKNKPSGLFRMLNKIVKKLNNIRVRKP